MDVFSVAAGTGRNYNFAARVLEDIRKKVYYQRGKKSGGPVLPAPEMKGCATVSKAKKIYIADDETSIRLAIKTFMENSGYQVMDFESGDALLAAFSQDPADLVVLDVMMPGSNGFVVCKQLRKISRVPIIMLSARDSDLDYATALDLGSDDYLVKPFSPMALVMRIKAIFRRIEFERQAHAGLCPQDCTQGAQGGAASINKSGEPGEDDGF